CVRVLTGLTSIHLSTPFARSGSIVGYVWVGATACITSSAWTDVAPSCGTPCILVFFFSSRRRHTILQGDWSSDVCSSDLIAGVITFVPYIGSMTGLMIATSVAIAQFWPDWKRIALVVTIFLVGQFIEGNIVSPKFVGERVGLHPVWLIFAMFAFGYMFGFIGLLIAVPLGADMAVVLRC